MPAIGRRNVHASAHVGRRRISPMEETAECPKRGPGRNADGMGLRRPSKPDYGQIRTLPGTDHCSSATKCGGAEDVTSQLIGTGRRMASKSQGLLFTSLVTGFDLRIVVAPRWRPEQFVTRIGVYFSDCLSNNARHEP